MKKFTAFLLSICLMISVFQYIPVVAFSSAGYTVEEFTSRTAKINTESALISDSANVSFTTTASGSAPQSLSYSPYTLLTNEDTLNSDGTTYNGEEYGGRIYCPNGKPDSTTIERLTSGNYWVELKYDFGSVVEISDILVSAANSGAFMTGEYKVYASESVDFPEAEEHGDTYLLHHYVNENNIIAQSYSYKESITARYVTLRIINPMRVMYKTDTEALQTIIDEQQWQESIRPRIYKFLIYGKYQAPVVLNSNLSATSSNNNPIYPDIDTYGSLTNANKVDYFSLSKVHYVNDVTDGDPVWTASEATGPAKLYNNAYDDSQCCNDYFFVDRTNRVLFVDGSRRYLDYIYDLGTVHDISHISVVHGNADTLMTGHYKIYASVSESRDFTEDDLLVNYENKNSLRAQTFSITEGNKVYARYICLRILNPVNYKYTLDPTASDWFVNNGYVPSARISEFQVYGENVGKIALNNTLSGTSNAIKFPELTEYNSITNPDNADNFTLSAIRYKNDTGSWKAENVTATFGALPKLYDGVGNHTDNFPGSGFYVDKTNSKLLLDGTRRYTDFVYDLGAVHDVSHIAVVHGHSDSAGALNAGHYQIYASETKSANFTEADLLTDFYNDGAHRSQTFEAKDTVYARYVCLRIINPIATEYAAADYTPTTNQLTQDHLVAIRLGQFQVYGTRLPGQVTTTGGVIDGWAHYKNHVDITKNLIADKAPESVTYINTDAGVTTPKTPNCTTSGITSTINAYDGQTQGGGNVWFVEGETTSSGFKVTGLIDDESRQYLQLTYQLDKTAKITDFALLGHRELSLSPSHYKVSIANSKDDLFTDNAVTVDIRTQSYEYTVATFDKDEEISGSWVAVRVICGVTEAAIGGTMDKSAYYSRVSHFRLGGEWAEEDIAADNLTVVADKSVATVSESNVLGRLDNNGNACKGSAYITVTASESASDKDGYYSFSGWYNGETLISNELTYDYYLTDTATSLTAKYDTHKSFTVSYMDASGNLLYETYVKENSTISDSEILNASLSVPELHGYVRVLDENNLQIWNSSDREPITEDTVLTPIYKSSEDTYSVTVTTSEGSNTEKMRFDQRFKLNDTNAKAWTLGGKVISYDTSVTLYVSGNMDIAAEYDNVEPVNTLTIMDTVKNQDSLSVLVRLNNVTGKEIESVGVIFVSGNTYDAVGNVDWTEDNLNGYQSVKVELDTLNGSEYMCTLYDINREKEVTRVAKAFVKFTDGTVIFSDATEKQVFKSGLCNPLIPTDSENKPADPWVVYHEGYYYLCFGAVSSDGYGIYITKCESLFDLDNPIERVQVYKGTEDPLTSSSWYAPELHNVNGKWYVYSAPAIAADSTGSHSMYVLEYDGDSPLADGENTKYTGLGFMTGLNENAWLNIDGTYFEYEGKDYFIWSDQGSLKIGELTDPTTVVNTVTIAYPQYEWEKNVSSLNEGPAILEHNGDIFLSFSASDSQSDYYAIGIIEFAGGDPLTASNWTKWSEPVLTQNKEEGIYGPGHNSFTKVLVNGNWVDYIVYHAHNKSVTDGEVSTAWNARTVMAQPFYWDTNGKPVFMPVSKSIY